MTMRDAFDALLIGDTAGEWMTRTASITPLSVIEPATSLSGMCDVTREVHSRSMTLNSTE